MASDAEQNPHTDPSAERSALPFEPSRKKESKNAQDKSSAAKASAKSEKVKSGKAKSSKTTSNKTADKSPAANISAKAQARVDEIRASRQRASRKATEATSAGSSRLNKSRSDRDRSDSEIPAVVSRRMLRRMAVFSGSPVFLGVGIFFLSYYLQSRELVTFPPVAVLLVTMGCFGLGVLGLTYGVLSASWDDEPGSLLGLSECKLNFGRARETWQASKASKS
jgi:hypothetical protein